MAAEIIVKDVMLNEDELGLAEGFTAAEESLITVLGCEEEATPGSIVFFGVDLPIGDIGEVKGKVLGCDPVDDGYAVTVEVLALDDRYPGPLTSALKGEASSVPDEQDIQWGIGLKQSNGAFAALVNCPAGVLNTDQLAKITELTRQGAGLAKLTHAQRVILLLKPDQIDKVSRELASVGLRIGVLHRGIRNIRGCCGALCRFSQNTDGLGLALAIDQALFGRQVKWDIKVAVSDCLRNCSESFCVDIGLIGSNGLYDIYVGGVASSVHLRALKLTGGIASDNVIPLINKILEWYDANGEKDERLHKLLERLGESGIETSAEEAFKSAGQVFDALGIGYDMTKTLTRILARGFGVKQMRADLGLS
ncbi:MAG: hypothetical protein HQK58_11850 [Deltaproteobacteria bacterium]|nr:hypothetical protein [Deltaproteobacteria bacterium]MBF0525843.1 hypothetical protein [Deltaproteobacteria bacterium]